MRPLFLSAWLRVPAPRGTAGHESGFSLVELLVAVSLFGAILLFTFGGFANQQIMLRGAEERAVAAEIMRQIDDSIRAFELGRQNSADERFSKVRGFTRRVVPVPAATTFLPSPYEQVVLPSQAAGRTKLPLEIEIAECPTLTGGTWDYTGCTQLQGLTLKRLTVRVYKGTESTPLTSHVMMVDDQ